ncbi:MAG TPA: cytochrome c [Candidatus Dormibacteraeota bacterium]|nr:cytochrome c [Candidatus Dormibacteraeota bacterium]
MNGRKTSLITVVGLLSAVLVAHSLAQGEHPTRQFMRQKLGYAQGVLEGITLEHFDLVTTNAAFLRTMSQTNAFLVLKNPEYLQRITNFQISVDALTTAAKEQNVEHATAAYQRMTESCVDCHKFFRREQFVKSRPVPLK